MARRRTKIRDEKIYLLSLDWDFLPEVKSDLWDWQHTESFLYREVLWPTRASSLIMSTGVEDPRTITAPRVKVVDLLAAVQSLGLKLDGASFTVSDSHCRAMPAFAPFAKTYSDVHILHFDAHHDLGYDAETMRDHEKRGIVACDDWLAWFMIGTPQAKLDIIYPEWRGEKEWGSFTNGHEGEYGAQPWYVNNGLNLRTGVYVWPEMPQEEIEPGRVGAIHFCRSGSWAPPWHDDEFIAATKDIAAVTGRQPIARWESEEKCNVLTPRAYSDEIVRAQVAQFREFDAQNEARRAAAKKSGGTP